MLLKQTELLLFICICTSSLICQSNGASRLKLNSEFRYVDLLIAVDEAYLSSASDVERLKTFLSSLSAYLADATEAVGRRLSLGQVRVLVPKSRVEMLRQAKHSLTPATWESKARADILVDSRAGGHGRVLHGGGCGEAGLRIDMPDYLMRPGNAGYILLARLFAQFRWGVLPETGAGGQKFYLYAEQFRPMMCSEAIPGGYQVTPGGKKFPNIAACVREANGVLTLADSCSFVPDRTGSGGHASLMSAYSLFPHVNRFCDSVNNPKLKHNRFAPTLHAKMCGQVSTAEVARRHADFAAGAGASSSATVPELVLIEPTPSRKIVLMLDISGSMVLENRMQNLITAATRYVTSFVEPGAQVAVASFNESVQVLQPLRQLNSLADREVLSNTIRGLVPYGWTNIADAIMVAMQMLGASAPYNAAQSGWVVLITDGEHNFGNVSMTEAIGNASLTSIVFDTICFSNQADKRLAQLSNQTGGWAMFSSSNAAVPVSTELDSAFAKLAERTAGPNRTVLLSASTFSLPMEPMSLRIDESVTSSLSFMLSFPGMDVATLNVTAKDPNGIVYGRFSGADYYETNAALGSVAIKIPDEKIVAGNWTVQVTTVNFVNRRKRTAANLDRRRPASSSAVSGSIIIIGSAAEDAVSLTAWLRHDSIDQVTADTLQLVFAQVANTTNNGSAVTGAAVQARVVFPTGDFLTVSLRDDGLGFDAEADDRIFTGAVTADQLTLVGDHSVTVSLLAPVQRVTSAGKFTVLKLYKGTARPTPGRITDLRVDMMVAKQRLWMTFTAPGDRAYTGTASSFELRASMQPEQLEAAFNSSLLIARLPGQPAGSPVQLNLSSAQFPAHFGNFTFYLSVAAVSNDNLTGQPAMPVGAMFDYPSNWNSQADDTTVVPATTPPISVLATDTSEASKLSLSAATWCSLVALLLLLTD